MAALLGASFFIIGKPALRAQTINVPVPGEPSAITVNPVSNKIYVGDGSLTIIDGATNDTTTISVGQSPAAVAVNPTTDKIYVACEHSVTVIRGSTNTIIDKVQTGASPFAIAINQKTDTMAII